MTYSLYILYKILVYFIIDYYLFNIQINQSSMRLSLKFWYLLSFCLAVKIRLWTTSFYLANLLSFNLLCLFDNNCCGSSSFFSYKSELSSYSIFSNYFNFTKGALLVFNRLKSIKQVSLKTFLSTFFFYMKLILI